MQQPHNSSCACTIVCRVVCGLEKRQQERPQQDITSDFVCVAM